jgi:hypothetical protein
MVKVQEPGKLTILEPMEATEQTERCMIHLDDNIYVVAKMYDEALQIYIRQYNQFGDKLYPSKKGVVLNLSRWLLLEVNLAKIDQHVKIPIDDSHHLGGGWGCLSKLSLYYNKHQTFLETSRGIPSTPNQKKYRFEKS